MSDNETDKEPEAQKKPSAYKNFRRSLNTDRLANEGAGVGFRLPKSIVNLAIMSVIILALTPLAVIQNKKEKPKNLNEMSIGEQIQAGIIPEHLKQNNDPTKEELELRRMQSRQEAQNYNNSRFSNDGSITTINQEESYSPEADYVPQNVPVDTSDTSAQNPYGEVQVQEPDWGSYVIWAAGKMKPDWTVPSAFSTRKLTANAVIDRKGKVLSASIAKSSMIPFLDDNAVKLLKSTRFAPLPPEFQGNSVSIDFVFDYFKIVGRVRR